MSDDYPDAWKTPAQRATEADNQTAQWLEGLRSGTGITAEPREHGDEYPSDWPRG